MADNPAMTIPAAQRIRAAPSSTGPKPSRDDSTTRSDALARMLSRNSHGWRRIIRNLSPSWFSTTMGTGVVSTIFIAIPWKAQWLYYLSIVFFLLNVALFAVLFLASVARYMIWPEIWSVMIDDPVNSLFLGTIPMGFATIIEMWISVCVPSWGPWSIYVAWGLWMLDSVVAAAVTVSLGILLMSASHQRSLDTITAAQLLPIAATIVAAGTGSKVANVLPNPQHALGTIIACYVMWGMATPMAFTVIAMYYHRLALHKMPPREVIVSAFLPLGPLGFGGYTILYLGLVSKRVFPETNSIDPMAGTIAYVLGFFVALIMWGWGLIWFALALASIYKARPFPFNMGWWGFTFPLGVYSVSTILIGEELPSLFFRVLGTIFGTAVIILWLVIAIGTVKGAWTGALFNAPCLANLQRKASTEDQRSVNEEEKGVSASQQTSYSPDANLVRMHSRQAPDIEN